MLTRGDQSWLFLVTQAVVLATIFLSITVITGMAGQISLCQGAFAATGAFTVFQLVDRYDMAVLPGGRSIGGLIAAAVGALLSLPIRRLGGVWTAIATLAFAYFFDSVVLNLPFVGGGETSLLQGTDVPRPVIGPFDFDERQVVPRASPSSSWSIVALVVVAAPVGHVRPDAAVALRGSEVGAESIGISPGRARLLAFAISAFIAALGGALLAMQQENVNYGSELLAVRRPVLGRHRRDHRRRGPSPGAIQAAAAFVLFERRRPARARSSGGSCASPDRIPGLFPISAKWVFVLFGLGTIQYARHPEGLVEYGLHRRAAKAERRRTRPRATDRRTSPSAPAPERLAPRSRCHERRAAGPGRHEALRRHRRARRRQHRDRRGRAGRAHRPQRRRQDDVLQLHARRAPDRRRHASSSTARDITALPVHRRARLGIGRTFQRIELFPDSTVRDHLFIAERVRRGRRPALEGPPRPRPAPTPRSSPAATRCSSCSGSPTSPTSRSSG